MITGIDVGGTFTDAVVVDQGKVITSFKIPTTENIIWCLNEALEILHARAPVSRWERLVISTTMLTNIVAQNRYDKTALMVIPGPGVNPSSLKFPGETVILSGAINYRGMETADLDEREVIEKARILYQKGYRRIAVVSKFSGRNGCLEKRAAELLSNEFSDLEITQGHKISGYLNFPRRCVSAWLTAATQNAYSSFINELNKVLDKYRLPCPVFIMKADGGVIPLSAADRFSTATVYSGPAASTVGGSALIPAGGSAVVMDVGGSTTDLSLVLSGTPLAASRGMKIHGLLTHTKGLAMNPVPLGGDAPVLLENRRPILLEKRKGHAACFGGNHPTLTDALNIVDGLPGERLEDSRRAFRDILNIKEEQINDFAEQVISLAVNRIVHEIKYMIKEWQDEPAYRIWEVLQKEPVFPKMILGIGGAAAGLTERAAAMLNMEPFLPSGARVANAIGCAVAKPSLTLKLHIDTEQKILSLDDGTQKVFNGKATEESAVELAKNLLVKKAGAFGLKPEDTEIETVQSELFNMIRGWYRAGYIIDVEVQLKPGLVTRIH